MLIGILLLVIINIKQIILLTKLLIRNELVKQLCQNFKVNFNVI